MKHYKDLKRFSNVEISLITKGTHPDWKTGTNCMCSYERDSGCDLSSPDGFWGKLYKKWGMKCIGFNYDDGYISWVWQYSDANIKEIQERDTARDEER